jgi:hypothetical protein
VGRDFGWGGRGRGGSWLRSAQFGVRRGLGRFGGVWHAMAGSDALTRWLGFAPARREKRQGAKQPRSQGEGSWAGGGGFDLRRRARGLWGCAGRGGVMQCWVVVWRIEFVAPMISFPFLTGGL